MAKNNYLNVQGLQIALMKRNQEDFISLTDMARYKDNDPFLVIAHWMRVKNTIEYLGAWEILHNSGFNPTEFGRLLNEAGLNSFRLTAKEWREQNPDLQGNMRDYAEINQLICLSNLENINSVLIEDGIPQNERLEKLNQIAIHQMTILEGTAMKQLGGAVSR